MFARTAIPAIACLAAVLGLFPLVVRAEERSKSAPAQGEAKPGLNDNDALSVQQQQIADKFKHLEEVLLRMAELTGSSDPRRAALLKKAVAQSKEQLIGMQFESLVELLKKGELSRASDNQTQVEKDLQSLLEILLSENRAKRLESEKARIREYLKQLNQIINQQKGIQGRTAGSGEPKQLAEDQRKLARKTGDLSDDIKRNEENGKAGQTDDEKGEKKDAQRPGEGDKNGDKNKDSQGKPKADGDKSKGQGQPKSPSQGKDSKGQGQQGQGKDQQGKNQQPSPGKEQSPGKNQPKGQGQGQGQQGQAQDQPSPKDGDDNPARKRLETARKRMQEAQKKLEEAQRKGATEKQEEAIRELEQAKAELEKILRQLREEEMERVLTMLEARFTRMLQMQREVYEGTVRLDKVPEAERNHNHEIESGRLSSKEAEIVLETDKALTLLREDGTAMAFPEAIEQARDDMEQVVQRLAQFKVNNITQSIEQDIISALEEMLAALKKAIQENQERQQGSGQPGEPQDPPLVDALSEIKMIRTLQMRVNLRTQRYSKMIQGEQADNAELVQALGKLAERQQRIYQITRDLQKGKNQ
jgi:hypothetical protein